MLEADASSRAAIAARLDLEGLTSLNGHLLCRPWLDGVEFEGSLSAVAKRRCGVTLDLFEEAIDESVAFRVVPAGSPNAARADEGEIVIDLEADDPPDEATGDSIDLAAYLEEFLALALDPFPRRPGAIFDPPTDTGVISPFAALAELARPTRTD
jgi:hypothetical protein